MFATPEFASLNSVKYLYLRKLSEPRDNSLRLVVDEASDNPSAPNSARRNISEFAGLLSNVLPIESSDGCKSFELHWNHYIAYLVTEEMVGSCGRFTDEVFTGKLFRVYNKSHFLDHLVRDTGAHNEPIQHYKLICLNHLIDVAAYAPPKIRLVNSPSTTSEIR